jgi:acetyl esterase/lipase
MKTTLTAFASLFLTVSAAAAPTPPRPVLIAATPITGAPAGSQAWRIRYRTIGTAGRAEATGIVVVPDGPAPTGGRDIVAWTHGTTGIADACAPSANTWKYDIIAGLPDMLARGYAVVAPDYIGLGSPGVHPFLVGPDTAHAVLDAVRAARAVPGANTSNRFAVWGESQGGHAALWTGQLAKAYAPDLDLMGVAAAAPATDLVANIAGGTNPAVRALLTSFAAASWSGVYHVPLSTIARPAGVDLIHRLARNCVTIDGFRLGTKIGLARMTYVLRNVDLAKSPAWGPLMRRNSVATTPVGAPLFVVQGSADVIIAPAATRAFVGKMCRAGQPVRFVTDGGDHVTAAKRNAAVAVGWIGDRFAGKPAPDDCAGLR